MRRTAQEEIVGFVVVVILIAIVALIFLSFSLRRDPVTRESLTLSQFLEAAGEYSTTCTLFARGGPARLDELYQACAEEQPCLDGTSSCAVINATMPSLITKAFPMGSQEPFKAYTMTLERIENINGSSELRESFLTFSLGNCSSGAQRGTSDFRSAGDDLVQVSFTLC